MLEQYCQQVSQSVVDKYGFVIPWELILEIVIELIDKCVQSDREFVDVAKNPTTLQRAAMNVYVRRVLDLSNRRRVLAVSEAIFAAAETLSSEQLGGVFYEANSVLQSS